MNTTPDPRAGLTIAQGTAQIVLLIIVSVVGTWLALYRVPWQVSGDPCLLAAAATGGIVTCLWLTRWRGLRGVIFERNLLAGFLVGMSLVYVARYLFVYTGRAANNWFWVEVLGTFIFAALAVLGVKRSPWFLAIGMVLHGLDWDTWCFWMVAQRGITSVFLQSFSIVEKAIIYSVFASSTPGRRAESLGLSVCAHRNC
jgi:hypothetical protein